MARILILGGTTEARQLATRLAGREELELTVSLAGRTAAPAPQQANTRIGGFGGAGGLARYLGDHRFSAVIDATHPYAAIISANAVAAARDYGVPLLLLRRPPWTAVAGDRWTEVADVGEAVRRLGNAARRVFLTLGRKHLLPFAAAPQHHYLIRSVDPVDPPLLVPSAGYITGRGPFTEADDRLLMTANRIDTLVSRNSGGDATYGKIAAARALGIEVIMLRRPPPAAAPSVGSIEDAIVWLDHALTTAAARGV